VVAYPGSHKTFEQFRADDAACRQYALESAGGKTAQQAATQSAVESAAIGTAIGAAAGALIGGSSSSAGAGAGTGLIVGSAVGADSAQRAGYGTQQRYDSAYLQCMYEKGEKVPVAAGIVPPPGAVYASPYPMAPPHP
jgi:hypothetical protein